MDAYRVYMSCALINHIRTQLRGGAQAPSDRSLFLGYLRIRHLPTTNKYLRVPPTAMSHTHPTGPSSPNFQLIFNNALKAYEKQTNNDILFHPLVADLQACQSPNAILAVLQQQVQELDQSRTSDERLTKWLDPTVNVLYAFSETIGEGVSLVLVPYYLS